MILPQLDPPTSSNPAAAIFYRLRLVPLLPGSAAAASCSPPSRRRRHLGHQFPLSGIARSSAAADFLAPLLSSQAAAASWTTSTAVPCGTLVYSDAVWHGLTYLLCVVSPSLRYGNTPPSAAYVSSIVYLSCTPPSRVCPSIPRCSHGTALLRLTCEEKFPPIINCRSC